MRSNCLMSWKKTIQASEYEWIENVDDSALCKRSTVLRKRNNSRVEPRINSNRHELTSHTRRYSCWFVSIRGWPTCLYGCWVRMRYLLYMVATREFGAMCDAARDRLWHSLNFLFPTADGLSSTGPIPMFFGNVLSFYSLLWNKHTRRENKQLSSSSDHHVA